MYNIKTLIPIAFDVEMENVVITLNSATLTIDIWAQNLDVQMQFKKKKLIILLFMILCTASLTLHIKEYFLHFWQKTEGFREWIMTLTKAPLTIEG